MSQSCLQLVGWYHSHPHCQPDPSLKDIDCQMSYQLKMKGSGTTYHPCLGFIVSAFDIRPSKNDAVFQAFWAMPPPEQYPDGYGIPMKMKYSVYQNTSLSEELLAEIKKMTDFYRDAPDRVIFLEKWINNKPFIEKLKSSLSTKLPSDQIERGTFLDYVQELLLPKKGTI
ncbi:MPN domain-containing protein-like [Gigantopelta aegis]|uniref:MPN domain-containing protein-like n=1 Tax=Gigantopelta aegis TaxID=1735272 RepID=UPI001B889128|nr:MPN domain-containing protein-like [Gigantopelta aegis]